MPYQPPRATQVVYVGRPAVGPKGSKAAASLMLSVRGGKHDVFQATLGHLGAVRSAAGVRYDDYQVLRGAAASEATFGCLKLALKALPEMEVRALMRTHSGMLLEAAARAGHIDYANWLIYTYGEGHLQFISER